MSKQAKYLGEWHFSRVTLVVLIAVAALIFLSIGASADMVSPRVVASDQEGITIEMTFPPFDVREVTQGDKVYQQLFISETGSTTEVGLPELPTVARYVAVPEGAQIELAVVSFKSEVLDGYRVYPAQMPATDADADTPEFAINESVYGQDAVYPAEIAALETPATIRGLDTVLVRFYPVQYNPVTSQIVAYSSIEVHLTFVGGNNITVDPRLRSRYYEDLYTSLPLNADQISVPPQNRDTGMQLMADQGCDLVIITHPDFLAAANALATWKRQKGIATQVRSTAEIGNTASAIKSFLQNAYNTWNPAPSFAIFLGDAEFVPTNYLTPHIYQSNELIGTDLYYATLDGTDYFPDISTGRIPVNTSDQATLVINKIINYEQNPPQDPAFYNAATVAAYFQDDNLDGYDDRPFVITSEEIRDFLLSKGYSVQRIYEALPSVNPTNYNLGTYGTGAPLPAEILRANGFTWSGNATQINNAISAGTFLLNHRDHGYVTGWGHPAYSVSNVNALANGSELPVVLSMNCQTGWFDDETDQETWTATSFAEAFLQRPNGGAVGVVAATRTSFSGHNDSIDKGIIDAIWPDFLSYSQTGRFADPQRRMGQALNYGKMYYATIYGESIIRKYEFEIFHYFGDPTMQIWTALPAEMSVSHASSCPAGASDFPVSVSVDGAVVTVVQDGTILGQGIAQEGTVSVPLSPVPMSGDLVVTAVDPDYVPYEGDVPVDGPTAVTMGQTSIEPGKGGVLLKWTTGCEISNLGFNIYRARTATFADATRINKELIPTVMFGTVGGASYSYVDRTAKSGITYNYWLECLDGLNAGSDIYYFGEGRWALPRVLGVTPNSGSKPTLTAQRFVTNFKDVDGDLAFVYMVIGASTNPAQGVFVRYNVQANRLSIYDPRVGRWQPGIAPGQNTNPGSLNATLRGPGSSVPVLQDDTALRVVFAIMFKPRFAGQHRIYLKAVDKAGNTSGWQQVGTVEVINN